MYLDFSRMHLVKIRILNPTLTPTRANLESTEPVPKSEPGDPHHSKRCRSKRWARRLAKDLENERTFVHPQKTWKKTEDSSVFLQSFFLSSKNNVHANSFRILLDGGATYLIYWKNFLRNDVPCHWGSGRCLALNAESAHGQKVEKSPQKSRKCNFST